MKSAYIISLIAALCPSVSVAERSITCDLFSAVDSDRLIRTIRVLQNDENNIVFEAVTRGEAALALNDEMKVLFSQTTKNDTNGDRFSTVVVSADYKGEVFTPVTWLIDWAVPSVKHTNLGWRNAEWTIYDRFDCRKAATS